MREPIRCSECVTPAAYHVREDGQEYIEIKSHHHGIAHYTRIRVGPLTDSMLDRAKVVVQT